nr:pentatricopeptide repeat-containing protein, mitochondrial [Quercus suber]
MRRHTILWWMFCAHGKVEEAVQLLEEMKGKIVDALNLFEEMKENGFKPDIIVYNVLAAGFSRNGLASEALDLLEYMEAQGVCDEALVVLETMLALNVEPSEIMYSKVLAALCRAGDMKKARWFLDFLVEKGSSPDVISYTMMIHGFCKMNCLQEAQDLFHDMKERGIEPDVITYTVLLEGLSKTILRRVCSPLDARENKEGKVDGSTVWTEMRVNGIRPDVICYTVLIDRYCKTENLQDAVALFDNMIDRGLEPDTVTYTALLSGYYEPKIQKLVQSTVQRQSRKEALWVGLSEVTHLQFVHAFTEASMNTAYQKRWLLYLNTKNAILKKYDGRFKEYFRKSMKLNGNLSLMLQGYGMNTASDNMFTIKTLAIGTGFESLGLVTSVLGCA